LPAEWVGQWRPLAAAPSGDRAGHFDRSTFDADRAALVALGVRILEE
jgi:hypothetical protein